MRTFLKCWRALLTPADQRGLVRFALASVALAMIEALSVFSIIPFMAMVVSDKRGESIRGWLPDGTSAWSDRQLTLGLGFGFCFLLFFANGVTAGVNWLGLDTSNKVQHRLSLRLLAKLFGKRYETLLKSNTSELAATINRDVQDAVQSSLMPATQASARVVSTTLIAGLLAINDPVATGSIGLVVVGIYAVVFRSLSRKIRSSGAEFHSVNRHLRRLVVESLQGLRDLRVLGRQQTYFVAVERASKIVASARLDLAILSSLPKHLNEVIISFSMMAYLFLALRSGQTGTEILPFLAGCAFAGYRLIPAVQQIYAGAVAVSISAPLLQRLVSEFPDESAGHPEPTSATAPASRGRGFVEFRDVTFQYEGKDEPTLSDLSLTIDKGSSCGLIGRTGSGKTTVVSLLAGLLEPSTGAIFVDGAPLDSSAAASWQRRIGYVAQDIYLADDTIAANIALGVPYGEIDRVALKQAATLASIDKDALAMPDGYDSVIGERGVQISGGQRARIGLARALYHRPELLILDEATAALDENTERSVLQSLAAVRPKMTIVAISHRPATLASFDQILELAPKERAQLRRKPA